jgi:RecA-family ATPase
MKTNNINNTTEITTLLSQDALKVYGLFKDLPDFSSRKILPVQHLIEGFLVKGGITIIPAWRGSGKSWDAMAIGFAVANELPWCGLMTIKTAVLILDRENGEDILREREIALNVKTGDNFKIMDMCSTRKSFDIDDPELLHYVDEVKPLIILDSFSKFYREDENSNSLVGLFFDKIRVLKSHGATILILHNTGKSPNAQGSRGASAIEDNVDYAYLLTHEPNGATLGIQRFKCQKNRSKILQKLTIKFNGQEFERVDDVESDEPVSSPKVEKRTKNESRQDIRGLLDLHQGMNKTEFVQATKTGLCLSVGFITDYLDYLIKEGELVIEKSGASKALFWAVNCRNNDTSDYCPSA